MNKNDIEDIYPLSSMQQALLFHHLHTGKSELGFWQVRCVLQEDINSLTFKGAWQEVVNRHTIMRTAFVWKSSDKPMQIVLKRVKLPMEQLDWSGFSLAEQQQRLKTYISADRDIGFKLSKAPLMRLALIRMAENTYQLIWSYHSLLLDGWSLTLLIKEAFTFYDAFCKGQDLHLERSRPYKNYIAWLQQQDMSKVEAYWQRVFKGFTTPTPLGAVEAHGNLQTKNEDYKHQEMQLSLSTTTTLQSFARQQHLTLNTLVLGAWALLLSQYIGVKDVVFGISVSGRSAGLTGVESMVGPFINTLPVRVKVLPESSLLNWLKKLQDQQAELREYESSPLADVLEWSSVPGNLPLFDNVLVFEKFLWDGSLKKEGRNIEMHNVRYRSSNPLTVLAVPNTKLLLGAYYYRNQFDTAMITRILEHFLTLLESIAANPEQRLSNMPQLPEADCQKMQTKSVTIDRQTPSVSEEESPPKAEETVVAPSTTMESLIAEIWEDLLGVHQISMSDNFFDLGGNSLLAMRVVARLEKAVGLRINPGELAYQTLGQLASLCEDRRQHKQSEPLSFAKKLFSPFKRAISHKTIK